MPILIEGRERVMKLRPLGDRVLVKRIEEEQMKGAIVVPDTAQEKPQEGKVIAVGDGKIRESGQRLKVSLKKGDRVLFGKYFGTEVMLDDEEYLMMREDDIFGIIRRK